MGLQSGVSSKAALPFRTTNKSRRQDLYIKQKKARDLEQRRTRFQRKREEDKDPELRQKRQATNVPVTLEHKRVWDNVDDDSLGIRVDVQALKRRRIEEEEEAAAQQAEGPEEPDDDDDDDSMLDSDDAGEEDDEESEEAVAKKLEKQREKRARRDTSIAPSTTSTNLDLTPSSFALKFPNLFSDVPPPAPKILVTTSLHSTLHDEARVLCTLFPNSNYIRRSAHAYSHKYSLREICKFSSNRDYTHVVMLKEDLKEPTGLTICMLPAGPSFHFSISNWIDRKRIVAHGNPTNHYPELILNNFKTPLGILTARLFMTLFPPQPEFQGRQVVACSQIRDHIFVRRFRYIFREKRLTEKNVVGVDGRDMAGVEGIRAGLQNLGPQFTLKLRRVDKGIGRAGSEGPDGQAWEWNPRMERDRKMFNL